LFVGPPPYKTLADLSGRIFNHLPSLLLLLLLLSLSSPATDRQTDRQMVLWTVMLFGFFPPAVLLVICAVDQSELE
jgi:hypothetical protein